MEKNVKIGSYTNVKTDKSVAFNFSTNLRAYDKVKFVQSVTDTLVDGSNYNSILRDIIFDFEIINVFTDADISEIHDAPDAIGKIEDFLIDTNIVDIVKANAETGLIDELSKAVDKNIEYRTGIHKNDFFDALSSLLNMVEKKIDSVDIDSIQAMAEKINSMTGEFTPNSILDAYSKTDMFKNRFKEIEKQRTTLSENVDRIIKE